MKLIDVMELKLIARKLSIIKIQNIGGRIRIIFACETRIPTQKIFRLYKNRKEYIKFLPEGGIELDLRSKPWQEIFSELNGVMTELITENGNS